MAEKIDYCAGDPLRQMICAPYAPVLADDGETVLDDQFATHIMKHCVRILERHLGKQFLYKNRMVVRILGLLQANEPRNRAAKAWALCFLMVHFEPVYHFIETLTTDKRRLQALMKVMPMWIDAQQNFAYNLGNVRNVMGEFFIYYMMPLYIFGPQAPPPAPADAKRIKR